jgi:hypothetical protein
MTAKQPLEGGNILKDYFASSCLHEPLLSVKTFTMANKWETRISWWYKLLPMGSHRRPQFFPAALAFIVALYILGYYIFRGANGQKDRC